MSTGAIKSQIAPIWNALWNDGLSNPMDVIERNSSNGALGDAPANAVVAVIAAIKRRAEV